jgi:hypothetical protein
LLAQLNQVLFLFSNPLLEKFMSYSLHSMQLISAVVLSTLVLSTRAEAAEVKENLQVPSSEAQSKAQSEVLKAYENIVIQEDRQTVLQTMPEHTFDTAQFTPSTFDLAQVTEPVVEQPLKPAATEPAATEDVTQAPEAPEAEGVQQTAESTSPEITTELPNFETSADLLVPTESTNTAPIAQTLPSEEEVLPTPEEATPDEGELDPGRGTRSGPSYVGVGGNFGTVGDSSVGDSGLIVYSKIGLTRFFSVRPAIATDFSEDATFLLPATLDVAPIRINNDIRLAPYFGGGAAVSTQGDFGPLVVGGVDLPVTSNLTATAGINLAILDPVDLGVFVGIGYNFSGF